MGDEVGHGPLSQNIFLTEQPVSLAQSALLISLLAVAYKAATYWEWFFFWRLGAWNNIWHQEGILILRAWLIISSIDNPMEPFCLEKTVCFYEPASLVLCLLCRAAVLPGPSTSAHFRRHKLVGKPLKQVLAFATSHAFVRDPTTVTLPPDGSQPINALPVLRGYHCNACRYCTINKKKIFSHLGNCGGLRQGQGWERVCLQSFLGGRYARYWIVQAEPGPTELDSGHGGVGKADTDVLAAVLACEKELVEGDEARWKTVEAPGGVDREDTWVRFMGWAAHLQGKNRAQLYADAVLPKTAAAERRLRGREAIEANQRLRRVAESVDRELSRSMLRIDRVPKETLKWLNSIDPSKPHNEPFKLKEKAGSMEFYSTCWQRYVCYCVRVWPLGRQGAESERGVRFTDAQWAALGTVVAALDAVMAAGPVSDMAGEEDEDDPLQCALDAAVFAFCIGSIQQKLARSVYHSPLLHFASVMAIRPLSNTWLPAHSFTRCLAGLLWVGRVLMLEHLFAGEPLEEESEVSFDVIDGFQEAYRTWLAQGSYTPFSKIVDWMAYGRGYRNKESGLARVLWENDKTTLSLQGERIRVADFQGMAQAAVREAEEALDQVAFGQWALLAGTVDLGRIVDSLVFVGPGHSFAVNRKNQWLAPGAGKLGRLGASVLWREVSTGDGPGVQIRRRAVQAYLVHLRRLRSALFVCTHIWAGQPGRGPEIATLKHCDVEQLPRNVFVFDGVVSIITDRDKNKAIRGIGRKVARFLPPGLSRMMVAYVAWVLPFERVVHALSKVRGPSEADGAWLWKDGQKGCWGTEHLTERLDLLSSGQLGVRLTVSSYRHVAIELGRCIKGLVIRQMELEAAGDGDGDGDDALDPYTGEPREIQRVEDVWDLQSTHSSRIARAHYAVHVLYPNQLQPEMLANYQAISRLWHEFLGRSDGAFGRKRARTLSVDLSKGRRRPCIGTGCMAAAAAGVVAQTEETVEAGENVKTRETAAKAGPIADCRVKAVLPDIDAGLQKLFGHGAQWRSEEQRAGMARIMALPDNGIRSGLLILVLPTGGGKSIFFLLPSLVEEPGPGGSVSIVVVPFVALADDLVARAQDFGVDCLRWQPKHVEARDGRQRDARLVVVSADVATCEAFLGYVESIRARGLLRRLFFDECHTVIVDSHYRARLRELRGLHRFGCPIVMLTATLPVGMEEWFRETMLAQDAVLVRTAAVKLNIRYCVETVVPGTTAVEDRVVAVMRRLEARMAAGQKGVVYCRSVRECTSVANRTGCGLYHSQLPDDVRRAALQDWAAGKEGCRWIAATSGLGTGVDIPGITGVVHMRPPYGLVDFVQQTGRGGRQEGEVVASVVVTDGRPIAFPDDRFDNDVVQADREGMAGFMGAAVCRRVALGLFLDGTGRRCREVGGACCDLCADGAGLAETKHTPAVVSRLQEHTRDESVRRAKLDHWLATVQTAGCPVCYVRWHIAGRRDKVAWKHEHLFRDCQQLSQKSYAAWRAGLRFAEYCCCIECGLPYHWCHSARQGTTCLYRNQVLPVLMVVNRSTRLRTLVLDRLGIDAGDDEAYRQWLVRSREMYGEVMTNGLAVWDLIVQEIC